jgi:hypothetical protein
MMRQSVRGVRARTAEQTSRALGGGRHEEPHPTPAG